LATGNLSHILSFIVTMIAVGVQAATGMGKERG